MKTQNVQRRNIHSFCRTCLAEIAKHSTAKGQKFNIHQTQDLAKWIVFCTSFEVEENDGYPKFLCQLCFQKLQGLYEFRDRCIRSMRFLKSILNAKDITEESAIKTKKKFCYEISENELQSISIKQESRTNITLEIKHEENNTTEILVEPEQHIAEEEKINGNKWCEEKSESEGIFEYKSCGYEADIGVTALLETAKSPTGDVLELCSENESEDFKEILPYRGNCEVLTHTTANATIRFLTTPREHLRKPLIKLQCEFCTRRCINEVTLAAHMRIHQGLRPYECNQCKRSFNKVSRLTLHVGEKHQTQVEPTQVTCSYEGCGKQFRGLDTLRSHYRLKHSCPQPTTKTYVCENCGRTFRNVTTLNEHRFRHLPAEEYPYHCEQCGKRYISQRTYREHQMRHSGIKNFVCPYCGMRKTTRTELRTHINYHTKEKQWPCPHCPSVFNSSANLGLHDRIVHKGIRRYICRYCEQSFGKAETLKHHEMRHTGEKPHECTHCGKRFIQLVALRAHQKTHKKANHDNVTWAVKEQQLQV